MAQRRRKAGRSAGASFMQKAAKLAKKTGVSTAQAMKKLGKKGKRGKAAEAKTTTVAAVVKRVKRRPAKLQVLKTYRRKTKAPKGKKGRRRRIGTRVAKATKLSIRGGGVATVKAGRRSVSKKFRQLVEVRPSGRRLKVFLRNADEAAAGESVSAADFKKLKKQYRSEVAAARKSSETTYGKRKPQFKKVRTTKRVRIAYGSFPRSRDAAGRLTMTTPTGHKIPLWAYVGAPSAAFYAKYPVRYAKKTAAAMKQRERRAAALEGLAKSVLEKGDMYTPNRRKTKKQKAEARRRRAAAKRRTAAKRPAVRKARRRRRHAEKPTLRTAARRRRRNRKGTRKGHRKGHRRMRKNGRRRSVFGRMRKNGFLAAIVPALKAGGFVVTGFLAHKALSVVVSEFVLTKMGDVFVSGGLANWRGVIGGIAVAAVGIPVAAKLMPERAVQLGSGMVASLLHNVVLAALAQAQQPEAAKYLAGIGDIPEVNRRVKWTLQGFGGPRYARDASARPMQAMAGPYAQAAAGMGSYELTGPQDGITQAAAGMGSYELTGPQDGGITQAAAGMGSYYLSATGEVTMDGIRPDDASMESALDEADRSADPNAGSANYYGDIPSKNISEPTGIASPVALSGAGNFGQGVFGRNVFT